MKRTDPYLKQISEKIQAARKSKGVSVRKLGEQCELNYSNLSRIEDGQYSSRILTLKVIAESWGLMLRVFCNLMG